MYMNCSWAWNLSMVDFVCKHNLAQLLQLIKQLQPCQANTVGRPSSCRRFGAPGQFLPAQSMSRTATARPTWPCRSPGIAVALGAPVSGSFSKNHCSHNCPLCNPDQAADKACQGQLFTRILLSSVL